MKFICGSCYSSCYTEFDSAEECDAHMDKCEVVAKDWDAGYVYGMIIEGDKK